MDRRFRLAVGVLLTLGLAGLALATVASGLGHLSVTVPPQPLVSGDLHIRFGPPHDNKPQRSYYYAVVVLKNYHHYSPQAPPPCAISSDMGHTEYGFPHRGKLTHLTLTPATSAENQWCPGTYIGAVYSVSHRSRCSRYYPCSHGSNRTFTGKLPISIGHGRAREGEPYSYPGGLPNPIDRSAHIVGRFEVEFVTSITLPGRHRIHRVDGPICRAWGISLPCRCPSAADPRLTEPARSLLANFGWVEITLSYQSHSGLPEADCPGGIAIESQAGRVVASAGYPGGPFGGGPGIASGATTALVLAPGTWDVFAAAGRQSSASTTISVVAGHGTTAVIQLP
jgi:hypothetical protein